MHLYSLTSYHISTVLLLFDHHHFCRFPPPPPHFYCFPVKKNRTIFQLLAVCPAHQRQFLSRTATLQQMPASVKVLYNVLKEYTPIPKENKRKLLSYKDAIVDLAEIVVS